VTPEASSAAGRDETKGHDLPDGTRYGCGVKSDGRGAIVKSQVRPGGGGPGW
jgi:hypothetical protein